MANMAGDSAAVYCSARHVGGPPGGMDRMIQYGIRAGYDMLAAMMPKSAGLSA